MNARPLTDEEVERLSDKAARLNEAMRKRSPTITAWDTLRCLQDGVRDKQLPRNEIAVIQRVLETFDVR